MAPTIVDAFAYFPGTYGRESNEFSAGCTTVDALLGLKYPGIKLPRLSTVSPLITKSSNDDVVLPLVSGISLWIVVSPECSGVP